MGNALRLLDQYALTPFRSLLQAIGEWNRKKRAEFGQKQALINQKIEADQQQNQSEIARIIEEYDEKQYK